MKNLPELPSSMSVAALMRRKMSFAEAQLIILSPNSQSSQRR
jgi:hypothetical protein